MTRAVLALCLTAPLAVAWAEAPVQNMTVKGIIKAPVCEITIENDGVVDYGKISPSQIKPGTQTTDLGIKSLDWAIDCDASTYLNFTVQDTVADSASAKDDYNFGLGYVNGDGRLGHYKMFGREMVVDGQAAFFGRAMPGDTTYNANGQNTIRTVVGMRHGWAHANTTGAAQRAGKAFRMKVEVNAFLAGTSDMKGPVTETVPLEGATVFTFAFGL